MNKPARAPYLHLRGLAARPLTLALAIALTGCQSLPWPMGGDEAPEARPGTIGAMTSRTASDRDPSEARADNSDANAIGPSVPASESAGLRSEMTAAGADPVSLQTVMESYRALLPLVEDPRKQVTIRHRLADLEFTRAERKMADTAQDELDAAIEAYQTLLREYPERAGNDQIHYQLSRAWEMRGMTAQQLSTLDTLVQRYPDSPYWTEAQFRRADLLFIDGRYAEAEQAFDQVTQTGADQATDPSFLVNAYYMRGWSQFKQSQYRQALTSYLEVLDRLLPEGQPVQDIDQRNKTLIEDLFRVFGLSLSYLDGAETLQALFRESGSRHYEILIYDRYSDLLLEREQYSDAIAVYEAFIEEHPDSRWAPRYHMNIIATLELAGFEQTIPARKAGFVSDYGLYSSYWAKAQPETLGYIREQLEQLLPELADRHYLLAGEAESENQARDQYYQAASYYAEFAATFPSHPRTPERLFLLGETYLELKDWASAIEAFERVAYDFPSQGEAPPRAAEAGYASVLAYREYARVWQSEPESEQQGYEDMQQLNRLRFANAFPEDPRAPDVFYIALQREFALQHWDDVVTMSARLASWQPAPRPELVTEAQLLAGHSLFELSRYAEAEQSYRDALNAMADTDERRSGVRENLAAAVFRQADQLAAAGNVDAAVSEYLRVGAAVPESALRANAEYDAASLLVSAERWNDAISVLTGFRARFPDHELADTVAPKLALAYRETGQWEQAGDELKRMVALASTPEEQRQNLQIAAELYDQAGNTDKAIDTWRQYANTYPEPADAYMEAANRLAELYQAEGDINRRDFWLRRQMAYVDSNPDSSDDRMRWLAASASATLSREALERYNAISLTLPLNESMVAKTEALEAAVNAYQKTAGYGLSSYATEAGYQIAHIYGRLGADLMDSERPPGLSDLELAQYELLLEEQAYPFEDNAIDIHEQNVRRAQDGIYDEWVQRSYEALKRLLPGRYNKQEITAGVVDELG